MYTNCNLRKNSKMKSIAYKHFFTLSNKFNFEFELNEKLQIRFRTFISF